MPPNISLAHARQQSLLPQEAGTFERVMSAAFVSRLARAFLLVAQLKTLWDPWACPLEHLPLLAWALSVDMWDETWPEEKKRYVVANARRLHLLKTTLAGIKAYVELVGGEIVLSTRPPARGFRVPTMTKEEWIKWQEILPQIRVYPYLLSSHSSARFRAKYDGSSAEFRNTGYREPSQGAHFLGQRAVLYDQGVERNVTLSDFRWETGENVQQVSIDTANSLDHYRGNHSFRNTTFHTKANAQNHIFFFQKSDLLPSSSFLEPGFKLNIGSPTHVFCSHIVPLQRSFRSHSYRYEGYRLKTQAPFYVYDRWIVQDSASFLKDNRPIWFRGNKRYGIDPYSAECVIRILMERSPAKRIAGFRSGFRVPSDLSKFHSVLDAIQLSKALRDTIRISTTTYRCVRLGDRLKLGNFKLGEIRSLF